MKKLIHTFFLCFCALFAAAQNSPSDRLNEALDTAASKHSPTRIELELAYYKKLAEQNQTQLTSAREDVKWNYSLNAGTITFMFTVILALQLYNVSKEIRGSKEYTNAKFRDLQDKVDNIKNDLQYELSEYVKSLVDKRLLFEKELRYYENRRDAKEYESAFLTAIRLARLQVEIDPKNNDVGSLFYNLSPYIKEMDSRTHTLLQDIVSNMEQAGNKSLSFFKAFLSYQRVYEHKNGEKIYIPNNVKF